MAAVSWAGKGLCSWEGKTVRRPPVAAYSLANSSPAGNKAGGMAWAREFCARSLGTPRSAQDVTY